MEAMKQEMDSMDVNKIWELLDLYEGFKPIGNNQAYKHKMGNDGKVETDKARLVAKDYTPKGSYRLR